MSRPNKPRPRVPDPPYFYTLAFRLAQAYGLKEQPRLESRPALLAWFADYRLPEFIEVFADCLVVQTEAGIRHRLIIDDV